PIGGLGFGVLRYLGRDPGIVESLARFGRAPVSFEYLGQWDHTLTKSSGIRFSRLIESARIGDSEPAYLLDVSAIIVHGELRMDWRYSAHQYRAVTVERLARSCIEKLRTLIGYCLEHADGGLTPSDFPGADLDQETLDQLLEEFGESAE
ncbi:MAG: hypothetical protein O7H39_02950, partial [Gammaproteobacteria bacterium]|nr:hypothetical protein [Gammaproteobacteria bacterium]